MANSAFKSIVQYVSGDWHDDTDDIGVCIHRVAMNNAIHYADEAMQVRCMWVAHTATDYLVPDTTSSADTWYRLFVQRFPVTLRKDGTGPVLRVRVAGASSQSNLATFRLVVSSAGATYEDVRQTTYPVNVEEYTTTGLTMLWLTGAATTITIPRERIEEARALESMTVSSSLVSIAWTLMTAEVWATVSNITSVPRLGGVYIAEYVGT